MEDVVGTNGPVVGELWIGARGEDEVPWCAAVATHNRGERPRYAMIAIELYDAGHRKIRDVGWRTEGRPLAPGESRREIRRYRDRLRAPVASARVTVEYREVHPVAVERLHVRAPTGETQHEDAATDAPLRAATATIVFGPARTPEQSVDVSIAIENRGAACEVRPEVFVFNIGGSKIRRIAPSPSSMDVAAGASTLTFAATVRPLAQFGRVTCIVETHAVVATDPLGVLTIVDAPPDGLAVDAD